MTSAEGRGISDGHDPLRITWLGHATAMIELGGLKILTDPTLTPRVAHLRRHHDVGPVERPDLVLISHLHMDHLHLPSLRLLGRDVRLLVPEGAGSLLRRRGFTRVSETSAGCSMDIDGVTIDTVPAVHPRRRGPHTRLAADAVGYLARSGDRTVYFPGDTDLFPGMADLGPVDVALLPIWGWGPTLGEGHLDPAGAARATEIIEPRLVLPIHWGTYSPIGIHRQPPGWLHLPIERFEAEMRRAGAEDRLGIIEPGGRLVLPAASSAGP